MKMISALLVQILLEFTITTALSKRYINIMHLAPLKKLFYTVILPPPAVSNTTSVLNMSLPQLSDGIKQSVKDGLVTSNGLYIDKDDVKGEFTTSKSPDSYKRTATSGNDFSVNTKFLFYVPKIDSKRKLKNSSSDQYSVVLLPPSNIRRIVHMTLPRSSNGIKHNLKDRFVTSNGLFKDKHDLMEKFTTSKSHNSYKRSATNGNDFSENLPTQLGAIDVSTTPPPALNGTSELTDKDELTKSVSLINENPTANNQSSTPNPPFANSETKTAKSMLQESLHNDFPEKPLFEAESSDLKRKNICPNLRSMCLQLEGEFCHYKDLNEIGIKTLSHDLCNASMKTLTQFINQLYPAENVTMCRKVDNSHKFFFNSLYSENPKPNVKTMFHPRLPKKDTCGDEIVHNEITPATRNRTEIVELWNKEFCNWDKDVMCLQRCGFWDYNSKKKFKYYKYIKMTSYYRNQTCHSYNSHNYNEQYEIERVCSWRGCRTYNEVYMGHFNTFFKKKDPTLVNDLQLKEVFDVYNFFFGSKSYEILNISD